MGTTLTNEQRIAREIEIRKFLDDGLNVAQIARALNVSRQAIRQFCAIRNWLPGDAEAGRPPKVIDSPYRKSAGRPRKSHRSDKSGLDKPSVAT
jgi:hypothetical protein